MTFEKLEQYCLENKWKISSSRGYLDIEKKFDPNYGIGICNRLKIGMSVSSTLKRLIEADNYNNQMLFNF